MSPSSLRKKKQQFGKYLFVYSILITQANYLFCIADAQHLLGDDSEYSSSETSEEEAPSSSNKTKNRIKTRSKQSKNESDTEEEISSNKNKNKNKNKSKQNKNESDTDHEVSFNKIKNKNKSKHSKNESDSDSEDESSKNKNKKQKYVIPKKGTKRRRGNESEEDENHIKKKQNKNRKNEMSDSDEDDENIVKYSSTDDKYKYCTKLHDLGSGYTLQIKTIVIPNKSYNFQALVITRQASPDAPLDKEGKKKKDFSMNIPCRHLSDMSEALKNILKAKSWIFTNLF